MDSDSAESKITDSADHNQNQKAPLCRAPASLTELARIARVSPGLVCFLVQSRILVFLSPSTIVVILLAFIYTSSTKAYYMHELVVDRIHDFVIY